MGNDKVVVNSDGLWGFTYFLGVIGASVYYIQQATGFWEGVLGIVKALFWPGMMVYRAMELMMM